jgi:hypothetical protein
VLRSGRAAQRHGIRTKRVPDKLTHCLISMSMGLDLFAGPSRPRPIEDDMVLRPRTPPDAARCTPCPRRVTTLASALVFPAKRRTSLPTLARREPGTKVREGETAAFEWSFPRMGCRGAAPRSGCSHAVACCLPAAVFEQSLRRASRKCRPGVGRSGGQELSAFLLSPLDTYHQEIRGHNEWHRVCRTRASGWVG